MKHMKEYASVRKSQLKEYIAQESITPTLLIVRVGDNKASDRYVRNKIKDCEEVGIVAIDAHLPEGISTIGLLNFIIGRSNIVGKPLARMLADKDCTVTLCHSKTLWEDIWNSVNNSDLTICAVGQPHFLDCSSLSIPVIDVGINFDREGKMCGDCFVWNGTERNVSPVPGGVGLLTRVALLENVVEAAYG